MIWEGWFTLGVIALCFSLLALGKASADIIMVGGLLILLLAGILEPQEALIGMGNEGVVTVGLLFIVAAGLRETGAIAWIAAAILGHPKSLAAAQLRLMAPVMGMSAFLNNTPVVAMMIPAVNDWARRLQISVSKLMIPLSYASIVGGTLTLIGTSTNLVVNGLLISHTGTGIGMWEIAWLGLPALLIVLGYTVIASRWLLPERVPAINFFDNMREYTVEMVVADDGPLVGKSIEEAGLRHLPGMFLTSIDRDGQSMLAVSPKERLQGNDRLIFAGVLDSVVDLQKIHGLNSANDEVSQLDAPYHHRNLVEVVVSDTNPFVGKTIRESRFRSHYNAAVIAGARNGERFKQKLGEVVITAGDTLLLETTEGFTNTQKNSRDFYLVSLLENSGAVRHDRAWVSLMILLVMVGSVSFELLTMFKASFLAAGLMVLTGCLPGGVARRSVVWQVLIVIAAAIGIGTALTKTGAATVIAEELVGAAQGDPLMTLVIIYLLTVLCTELITNNAAAVLMFPIALTSAQQLGVNVLPFAIAIMFAASCSFATPIGYQTNLMVYGPGGYHFSDFLRFGLPLTFLLGVMALLIIPQVWSF